MDFLIKIYQNRIVMVNTMRLKYKTNLALVILLLVFPFIGKSQTLRYVNNTTSGTAAPQHYTNLQTAINAANPGDTIYIAPSPNSYGTITLSKRLYIVGTGYNPWLNPTLGSFAYNQNCVLANLTIGNGATNCKIEGLVISSCAINNVNNLKVQKCYFSSLIEIYNSDSILIASNFFPDPNYSQRLWIRNNSNQVKVYNNIFGPTISNYNNILIESLSDAIIRHNVFLGQNSLSSNCVFENNILLTTGNALTVAGSNISVLNNVFAANETDFADGNIINYGAANICIGYPAQGNYSFDSRYMLAPGSPAIGYGIGGVDCGAYDGPYPYKLSGLPQRPVIMSFNIPNINPVNGSINVNLSTRSNN